MTVVTGLFLGGLLVLITDFWNSSREQAAIAQQVSSNKFNIFDTLTIIP